MARTRIATVGYLNARPLTAHLDRERYELVEGVPSDIAERLRRGEVDVALVPVAAVLADPSLRIVPGQAIGADGPVTSVLLVAETPPEAWSEVALDGESRTSALLTRVLLAGPLAARVPAGVQVRELAPGAGVDAARGPTAALVIGDAARELPARLTVRLDLAELWKRWTGLPFVFAVWAARGDLHPDVREDLRAAARAGLADLPGLAAGADLEYLSRSIRYALDDAALMGLRRFAALARRGGWLPAGADVSLFGPPRTRLDGPLAAESLVDALVGGAIPDADGLVAILRDARVVDLAAAADLRRRDLHPGDVATWLPAEAVAPTLAEALAADEAALDAWVAAGQVLDPAAPIPLRATLDPELAARLDRIAARGLVPCLPLCFGPEDALPERAAALLALRAWLAAHPRVVALTLVPRADASRTAHTATEALRLVALARLVLDLPHLVASAGDFSEDLLQALLHAGCDALGAAPVDAADATERVIREAGRSPMRRDPRFTAHLDPLTDGASIARRQPWTAAPAPR